MGKNLFELDLYFGLGVDRISAFCECCSGFKPGFYVNSVFDLSCLVSPYLFSALVDIFVCTV